MSLEIAPPSFSNHSRYGTEAHRSNLSCVPVYRAASAHLGTKHPVTTLSLRPR